MNIEQCRRQWQDPTAEEAIGLTTRNMREGPFPNTDSFVQILKPVSLKTLIEQRICANRRNRTIGIINNAQYRKVDDSLQSQLKQLQKAGR